MNTLTIQNAFFAEKTFENYSNEAALEFLLTTAGVRGDVPKMVADLTESFGSFKAVLEARPAQLMKIPGVTKRTATLISTIVPMARVWERCAMADMERIGNTRDAERYCKGLLMGERNEQFYVICLDAQCRVLGRRKVSEGTLSEVSAYPRTVMEAALMSNAHSVLLCHNHPGGTCAPSHEDVASTLQLQRLLNGVNILVLDHLIVAGEKVYSMIQHGDIDYRCR